MILIWMEINISPNIRSIKFQILDKSKNHLKLYHKMSCMKNKRQKKEKENEALLNICTDKTQKSKIFGEKNRSFKRNNDHAVKK